MGIRKGLSTKAYNWWNFKYALNIFSIKESKIKRKWDFNLEKASWVKW